MNKIFEGLNLRQVAWHNPLFVSMIITIILILIGPVDFINYTAVPGITFEGNGRWYEDLEGDGNPENLNTRLNTAGNLSLIYFNENNVLIDQYNFHTEPSKYKNVKPPAVDMNKDSVKEIILFSQHSDSLFLNIFDYKKEKPILEKRFIAKIGGYNSKKDYTFRWIGHYDTNSDLVPELYFCITGNFSLTPRRVYGYDFANDSLISSENTGAAFSSGEIIPAGDSAIVLLTTAGFNNIPPDYPAPFHDSCSWVFFYSLNLKYIYEPVPFSGGVSMIDNFAIIDSSVFFIFKRYVGQEKISTLYKMNLKGVLTDSIVLGSNFSSRIHTLDTGIKKEFIIYPDKSLPNAKQFAYSLDPISMELVKTRWSRLLSNRVFIQTSDFTGDGRKEVFVYNNASSDIEIYNYRRKMICTFHYDDLHFHYLTYKYQPETSKGEIIILNYPDSFSFMIFHNKWTSFKYLVWVGYYFLTLAFVSVIFLIQVRRNKKMIQMEGEISRLHLMNVQNQLDPHFTMNALNTVGNYIYNEKPDKAYDIFQRFAMIIRSSIEAGEKVLRTLREEIEFTENYLELQHLRFPDKFAFNISVDAGIDQDRIQIPRMIIQEFAENSIKHAFFGIDYKGQIQIRIKNSGKSVIIEIEDNGIGLSESNEHQQTRGTHRGIDLIRQQINLTNKLYHTNFKLEIIDKVNDDNRQKGTIVRIMVG